MTLRRDFPQVIYEEAWLAFWKRTTRKHKVTVRIDYRNGYHFFSAGSPPIQLELSTQLTRARHLACSAAMNPILLNTSQMNWGFVGSRLRSTFQPFGVSSTKLPGAASSGWKSDPAEQSAEQRQMLLELVLLCYKKSRRQQGHLGRERARCAARCWRRVAMEQGLCRSVRVGSAAGRVAEFGTW